jgi:hypothetical protein
MSVFDKSLSSIEGRLRRFVNMVITGALRIGFWTCVTVDTLSACGLGVF